MTQLNELKLISKEEFEQWKANWDGRVETQTPEVIAYFENVVLPAHTKKMDNIVAEFGKYATQRIIRIGISTHCSGFIEKECKKLEYIIKYYDNYVAGQGRQSAEALAANAITAEADWFYIPVINSLPKLQKAYAKLQQLRQQLEDKIKSGI